MSDRVCVTLKPEERYMLTSLFSCRVKPLRPIHPKEALPHLDMPLKVAVLDLHLDLLVDSMDHLEVDFLPRLLQPPRNRSQLIVSF